MKLFVSALIAIVLMVSPLVPLCAEEVLPPDTFLDVAEAAPLPEWSPPPPNTEPLVREGLSPQTRQTLSRVAFVVSIGGLVCTGFGISEVFSSLTQGPDSNRLHRGITFAVSGSVVSAVFSAFRLILARPTDNRSL